MARPAFRHKGGYDKQLEALVGASSWKQAIGTCEKRIKKGDKSDETLVTKAHVLLECPDLSRREQGRKELDILLNKDPPITDIEVLLYITRFAEYREESDEQYVSMWERAAKARPNDEDLYRRWFGTALATKSYRGAQKASLLYRNAFPKRQDSHFWYIVANHVLSSQPTLGEQERNLFGQLGYKTIAKAASAGAVSGDPSSIGLALHTLEDLLFLLRIYRSQNKFREALAILDDSRIGIDSSIGNKQWVLVRQKIELLELDCQWETLWDYCHALLDDACTEIRQDKSKLQRFVFGKVGDDWKVWTGLVIATSHIGTQVNLELTEDIIQTCAPYSRNARLALLKLHASSPTKGIEHQAKLLSACLKYFKDYSTKLICFHDLRPYIAKLSNQQQLEFLKLSAEEARNFKPIPQEPESKAISWITAEINILKLDYFLHVSKHPNYRDRSLLEAFVCNALRLYKISLKLGLSLPISERRPGDDAAVLAAMAMFHLSEHKESYDGSAFMRSCVILSCILADSKHNYDALSLQVRAHCLLGSTSLAIDCYSQLSVKNIQYATLSWMLFYRISTLHPYPSCQPSLHRFAAIDPSESLRVALDWHSFAENINQESIVKMLRQGQYNMLFDAFEFGNSLVNGYSRVLIWCELRRVQRLTNASWRKDYRNALDERAGEVEDNIDFAAFPNCESLTQDLKAQRIIGQFITIKNVDKRCLLLPLRSAWLWDFFHGKKSVNEDAIRAMYGTDENRHLYMTPVERGAYEIILRLEQQCGLLARTVPSDDTERSMLENFLVLEGFFNNSRDDVKSSTLEWMRSTSAVSPRIHGFSWLFFHWNFVVLDVCQICCAALQFLVSSNRTSPGVDATFLGAMCQGLKSSIQDLLTNMKVDIESRLQVLRDEGTAIRLARYCLWGPHEEQDAIGEALAPLIGQNGMKTMATAIVESWAEAIEGIGKAMDQVGK